MAKPQKNRRVWVQYKPPLPKGVDKKVRENDHPVYLRRAHASCLEDFLALCLAVAPAELKRDKARVEFWFGLDGDESDKSVIWHGTLEQPLADFLRLHLTPFFPCSQPKAEVSAEQAAAIGDPIDSDEFRDRIQGA